MRRYGCRKAYTNARLNALAMSVDKIAEMLPFACQGTYRYGMQNLRAVILDRDGVINFDSPDYILTPEQWRPIPGSLEAIADLTRTGIPVAIASNQSALARGMIDQATFAEIHGKMMQAIERAGGRIAHVAYCPHGPDDGCACRKPAPGLIVECLRKLGLADRPGEALMIGDSLRDIEAAHAAGVKAWLVQTGYGDAVATFEKARALMPGIRVFADLAEAVHALLADQEIHERSRRREM